MFVAIEGPDGVGKSTICKDLHTLCEELGLMAIHTFSPGNGSKLSLQIRDLMFANGPKGDPLTQFHLSRAARAEHTRYVIEPALRNGRIVICDRYDMSAYVYQTASGLDWKQRFTLTFVDPIPDLYVVLDGEAFREGRFNSFDKASDEYRADVRARYRGVADAGAFVGVPVHTVHVEQGRVRAASNAVLDAMMETMPHAFV